MGGIDKGLLAWAPGTLAGHAAARLALAGLHVRVSANRRLEDYQEHGLEALTDRRPGFNGPLAGLEAGLHAAGQGWLLAVPCDSPFFPDDLPQRLWRAVALANPLPGFASPQAAYARCGEAIQPAFCIVSTTLAATLTRFLDDGGRRMTDWWQAIGAASVDFGADSEAAFANANTPEQYQALCHRRALATGLTC
jgi:molybdenum cofactor guanylyltransferase